MERLWENPVDDLKELENLVNDTRRLIWQRTAAPSEDGHLEIKASKIPKAQLGLFAADNLPAHTVCCYYSGDVHNAKSSLSRAMLGDASYLLRIGIVAKQPWWYDAIQKNADPCFVALKEQWDQIGSQSNTELFVNPTNLGIKARYINDCLREDRYNVKFVWDPSNERAALVTLRDIQSGEELYVSYGRAYWESMEAATGIVPQQLPSEEIS